MYNEQDDLFIKSMVTIWNNSSWQYRKTLHIYGFTYTHESSKACPFSWFEYGWKDFVVVIVSDGRNKIQKRVLTVLEVLGVYVDGLCRTSIDGKAVEAHLFEYTTQIAVCTSIIFRSIVIFEFEHKQMELSQCKSFSYSRRKMPKRY
jgi:chitin synthase